jgi:dihydrofolate synthase / folylpolyglutamate synthase
MTTTSLISTTQQVEWSLDQWLNYLSSIHPQNIAMGLDRVSQVFTQLAIDFKHKPIVTVAGTNGKGTTCAMLEQALLLQGRTVGVFSSPHILDYRERVRINGQMLDAKQHCDAFLRVEQARQTVPLTYFEFGTLQALVLIYLADVDVVVLEVGLGGRLDAVNIIDPTIAVITSIDLDHQEWLGDTREAIAVEKAGIMRRGIPVVIGEPLPPQPLQDICDGLAVDAHWQGRTFHYTRDAGHFTWSDAAHLTGPLPLPNIPLQNASTAFAVMSLLGLDMTDAALREVLLTTQLPGRRQIIHRSPLVMLDVAHNPQAGRLLAADIAAMEQQHIHLVVGMLADKDIQNTLLPMLPLVDNWYVASLDVPRGASSEQLAKVLTDAEKVLEFDSVAQAYQTARLQAQPNDVVVVMGSFYTVAEVLQLQEVK